MVPNFVVDLCWGKQVANRACHIHLPLPRDEEYDRGKTKKVRNSKQDFGGPNPFQEEANYISQRKSKQKSYKGKSWNKPNMTEGLRI